MNNTFSTQNKTYEELLEFKKEKINEWLNYLNINNDDDFNWKLKNRVFVSGFPNILYALKKINSDELIDTQEKVLSLIGTSVNVSNREKVYSLVKQLKDLEDGNIVNLSILDDKLDENLNYDLDGNIILTKAEYDKLESIEKEHLKMKNSDFVIKINKGLILPKMHPNYYDNRIFIKIFDEKNYLIQINNDRYEIKTKYFYNEIKETIENNLDNLISIAKLQNKKNIDKNWIDNNQISKITIKYNGLIIYLNGQVSDEIGNFCNYFINILKKIVIEDANKDDYDFLLKKLNVNFNNTVFNGESNVDKKDLIIKKLLEKIKNLPDNSEFSFKELLGDDSNIVFDIALDTLAKVESNGIIVQSKYGHNSIVGLPQNITYIKKGNIEK